MNDNKRREYARFMDDIELVLGQRKVWLTVPESAQITGAHKHTISEMCSRGTLPAHQHRKGSPYRIHYRVLWDAFVEEMV